LLEGSIFQRVENPSFQKIRVSKTLFRDSEAIMISLHDFDFPEGESSSPEDIVHDGDDPKDFSWWQPAFDVLAPPDAEKDVS
jgi:hypothetical protein